MTNGSSASTSASQPVPLDSNPKRGRKRAVSYSDAGLDKGKHIIDFVLPVLDSQSQSRHRKPNHVGPAFDETPSAVDPRYIDIPEKATKHGRQPDQLARLITRPCYPRGEEYNGKNHHFRCIASSVCEWARTSQSRQLQRIYTHASRCRSLAKWKPDLFAAAERALANMAPGGLQPPAGPDDVSTPNTTSQTTVEASPIVTSPPNPFARFDPTTHMSHYEQIDHAVVRLLCDSAAPIRLIDYPAWGRLLQLINPQLDYSSPSSSHVREKLVPAEAQRAVLHMREYLKTQTNLSLSFDGLNAGHQPVYTVHVCTPDRRTFLYYADIFYGSHNSDYIEDVLLRVIDDLGAHRISSIVSDDTSVTKKARRLATARYPSILNLADPVHKLNLCIQDICLDRLWTSVLNRLRKLLTHFKLSTQATGKLNAARKILGILRRLQSIGKTRFATVYYAAISVLENLPALYKIYSDGDMDTAANPLPQTVAEVMDAKKPAAIEFRLKLTELVNVLEPFARAILCLESTKSTIGDVYFFWLAALAALNQLFCSTTTTLTSEDISRLQGIIYYRFNEAINEAPTDAYVTAFFLDPRYRTASIYSSPSDLHAPQPVVVFEGGKRRRRPIHSASRLTNSVFSRVEKQLKQMLRDELTIGQKLPGHPLYQYDALRAKNELTAQLQQYHEGCPPFRQFSGSREGVLEYWVSHQSSYLTFVLSYLAGKLFSVLPNSMCDERAGSRLTHLYSKLRTQLDAKSMIEQIQFSQFMAMVDGTETVTGRKPLPARSRFYEIKQETLAEYDSQKLIDDCPVALADESGEEWLDGRENNKGALMDSKPPKFGECPSLEAALRTHCIELDSRMLVDALNTAPADKLDALLEESQVGSDVTSVPEMSYVDVLDVSWDD
ncbi:hypothetical protein FRC09_020065 [Ceratobasidium sp. 395]|nr:hypothetical protein FRC09_020065 [Ceratobasidium sp. 395]